MNSKIKKMVKKEDFPQIEVDWKLNIAYLNIKKFPSYVTMSIDLDEDITAHIDPKKKEIVGFTILHLRRFWNKIKEEKVRTDLRKRARESAIETTNYILQHYSNTNLLMPMHSLYPYPISKL